MNFLGFADVFANPIGNIVSSVINSKAQDRANQANIDMQRETNAFNAAEAEKAYLRDIDFWERQNAYNSPAAQMARLQDAGLNPMLAYSNGVSNTSSGNVSYSPSKADAPHLQAYTGFNLGTFGSMVQLAQSIDKHEKEMKILDEEFQRLHNENTKEGYFLPHFEDYANSWFRDQGAEFLHRENQRALDQIKLGDAINEAEDNKKYREGTIKERIAAVGIRNSAMQAGINLTNEQFRHLEHITNKAIDHYEKFGDAEDQLYKAELELREWGVRTGLAQKELNYYVTAFKSFLAPILQLTGIVTGLGFLSK